MALPGVSKEFGRHLPSAAVLALFTLVVGALWVLTVATSTDLGSVLMVQLGGIDPVSRLSFLALVGVMMGAMMLPAALPMLDSYRGLASLDSNPREGSVRAGLFAGSYLLLWLAFTALALIVLLALGLMGTIGGWGLYVPGGLLVVAGVYQFSSWKRYCLSNCRTPTGFIMEHWRGGRSGAVRMGLSHGLFCLGCCWVLMLVVFVTGAMSLLWMAGFSALVLIEKVWSRGEGFAKLLGAAAAVGGIGALVVVGLSVGVP
ncbi:MAG TPA: DUF2182 domain-containing protein [Thermoplasmata archaeon]|nr:DUF2182 domain-containing protein [Thermoplasmata archaeon]